MEEKNYNFTDEEAEFIVYVFEKYKPNEHIALRIVNKIIDNMN